MPGVRVLEANAAQTVRVFPAAADRQRHRLVADDALRPVAGRRVHSAQVGVRPGPCDAERARFVPCEQPLEVEAGPVHDVNRRRFGNQQVEKCVHLHSRLGAAKRRPGEQRQAQVDGGGVRCVHRVRQLQPQVLPGARPSGPGDQPLGELGVHAPVPALVGVGQGGAPHGRADTHVVQPGRLRARAGLDVAQALAVRQPGKSQCPVHGSTRTRRLPSQRSTMRAKVVQGRKSIN